MAYSILLVYVQYELHILTFLSSNLLMAVVKMHIKTLLVTKLGRYPRLLCKNFQTLGTQSSGHLYMIPIADLTRPLVSEVAPPVAQDKFKR